MDKDQAEKIVSTLKDEGYEAYVAEDYSGRGMYGSTCTGIVTDAPAIVVGYTMAGGFSEDDHIHHEQLPGRVDSMGLDTIYY